VGHCWIEYREGEILDPAVGWVGVPNEFWVEDNRYLKKGDMK